MKRIALNFVKGAAIAAGLAGMMNTPVLADQGVSDTEVVIGSNGDLSGPFAPFYIQAVKVLQDRIAEVNAAGGIHGRTIRLVVEDHGYQVPKAVANFNKMINSDKVFAMILNLGTPTTVPGLKMMAHSKVANIAPLTLAREMIEGDITYKYLSFKPYFDQMKVGIKYLHDNGAGQNVCAMYIPSGFGKELVAGSQDMASQLGMTWKSETTHKPDEGEFVGALTKLRNEGCNIIVMGLGVRQTIITLATSKKLGWDDVKFIGSSAAFHEAVSGQPGGITDGFYAASGIADYTHNLDKPAVAEWAAKYKAAHDGEVPGVAAVLGEMGAATLMRGLEAAGPDLTSESLRTALEGLEYYDEIAGVQMKFDAETHMGGTAILVMQVQDGKWVELARE